MFGDIFKKFESPSAAPTPEDNNERSSHNSEMAREQESLADLYDFLEIERAQNQIKLRQNGIETDISSMFASPAPDAAPPNAKEEKFEDDAPVVENVTETPLPQEIQPETENDLILQIKNEYAASIFFDKAREALIRRKVDSDNMADILEKVFAKMAKNAVEQLKGEMTKVLHKHGLDDLDTKNYLYWRLNEYTENNPMYLVQTDENSEKLIAENFVSEKLLDRFYTSEDAIVGTSEEEKQAQEIVTSEKIDALLDEINSV